MNASITSVTADQIKQAGRLAGDVSESAMEIALNQMVEDAQIDRESLQRFLGKGNCLKTKLIPFLKEMINELGVVVNNCIKLISRGKELKLDQSDGTETLAAANDVFNYIDSDFRRYGCDAPGQPAPETSVQVYEMTADADFKTMFGSFEAELDSLCLTQAQIKQFVKKHRKWLRTDGYATFFLFKVGNEFFVAHVDLRSDGGLDVHVSRFSRGHVWLAADRPWVVVPQLKLKP